MMNVNNEAGVFNARKCRFDGKEYTVTHRNPANGMVYLEDYFVLKNGYGKWVRFDEIELL